MTKTITLYDYIASELQQRGHSEFVNDQGEWVAFDKKHQFIQKIMHYDEDVAEIVDELFLGSRLDDQQQDDHFKRLFILNFMERSIAFQSVEIFASKLSFVFLANQSFINTVLTNADDYITMTQKNNQSSSEENESTNVTDNRQAFADLPQSEVNLDLDDDTMDYATDNTVSKNKQGNTGSSQQENQGETKTYQLDNLIKSQGLLQPIFQQIDQRCFLQKW